jgi:hypothetical protein
MSMDQVAQKLPTYRLDQRRPDKGQKVMLTARDHLGPYPIDFACEWDGEGFLNPNTGKRLQVAVVAWRPTHVLDRHKPYKPSRLTFHDVRSQAKF